MMFGEEVVLAKAIDYIAYRVKKGYEEKEARRELLQNLEYLANFYEKTIESFHNSNHNKVIQHSNENKSIELKIKPFDDKQENFIINIKKLDSIIDYKKAINLWQYLDFDRIFMVENKTNIDYIITLNNDVSDLNKEIIDFTADGCIILQWTARHIWTYYELIIKIEEYMYQLDLQLKQIKTLISSINENQK